VNALAEAQAKRKEAQTGWMVGGPKYSAASKRERTHSNEQGELVRPHALFADFSADKIPVPVIPPGRYIDVRLRCD
jgi:hypothetical protein